jgi:radical SAM superfamily enzyme YgiQ (UPF0313 family)
VATLAQVRLLLLSTYELGHQPLGLAGPAALLAGAGHEVRCRDLSIEALEAGEIEWADALVFSVPMHTALRLTLAALDEILPYRPGLPVALHGLYATVGADALRPGDLAIAGEVDDALLEWVAALDAGPAGPGLTSGPTVRVELGRPARSAGGATVTRGGPAIPDRSAVPPLERYARLLSAGPDRVVGAIETTRGCSHRCRHCPVPTVYDGRTRAVPLDAVLADAAQVVAAGAGHLHFADPDFLNRPAHALRIVRSLHEHYPAVSFDATIKVSHLLAHRDAVAELGASGCAFVVSAFESTSPVVLERLDKGHTAAEAGEAVAVLRAAGIEPRPSFLPFTPWTTVRDLVDLLDFVAAHDLVESVDPVQYGIRLLLPPGSLLLTSPDPVLTASLGGYEPSSLGWTWTSREPGVDDLQRAVALRTEEAACCSEPAALTYAAVRELAFAALGTEDPGRPPLVAPAVDPVRPRLSEAWFCCAEPTSIQLGAVGSAVVGGTG